jgi:hypothetical protein
MIPFGKSRQAHRGLRDASAAWGRNFGHLDETVHAAMIKEAVFRGVDATVKLARHFSTFAGQVT